MASFADSLHKRLSVVPQPTGKISYIDLDEQLEVSRRQQGYSEFEGVIGVSEVFREVLDQVRIVAPTDSTVLIEGETGTGKEVIANAIHIHSKRRGRPLIKVNCAAIPEGLLESELFGHEKGAFTGALVQRVGRFEAANAGTLFLDEIGDIPLALQAKLLRVLQEQEFERLGSTHTHKVNMRVVAATNQDLARMVAEKQFRMDLFYRLNVFPIELPPLRMRASDIPSLVALFVQRLRETMGKTVSKISQGAMEALKRYPWPGNIRELQNFIEHAVILSHGHVLQIPRLPSIPTMRLEPVTLEEAERDHIVKALEESNWVVGGERGAAARLGVKRTTLIDKMRRCGISRQCARVNLPCESRATRASRR